jgi:hypothetical protein
VVGEGCPADGGAAPLEDAAVGDAGVGASALRVEGEALGAGDAAGQRKVEAPPSLGGPDKLRSAR